MIIKGTIATGLLMALILKLAGVGTALIVIASIVSMIQVYYLLRRHQQRKQICDEIERLRKRP